MKSELENTFLLYHDKDGKTDVSVRFADEDVWVTQVQLAELYETTQQNISLHIDNIYKDEELPKEATHKEFLLVQQEGKRQVHRKIAHYNLDVIIAIGYRVQSPVATRFRRWATARLHEFIQKGFSLDDERLKNGRNRYFKELQRLNLMVSQFLDFAELQALDEKPMKMQDWVAALDSQIVMSQRKILEGKGKISHDEAMEKAEREYSLFRQKELANLKSDFDLFLEETKKLSNDKSAK